MSCNRSMNYVFLFSLYSTEVLHLLSYALWSTRQKWYIFRNTKCHGCYAPASSRFSLKYMILQIALKGRHSSCLVANEAQAFSQEENIIKNCKTEDVRLGCGFLVAPTRMPSTSVSMHCFTSHCHITSEEMKIKSQDCSWGLRAAYHECFLNIIRFFSFFD